MDNELHDFKRVLVSYLLIDKDYEWKDLDKCICEIESEGGLKRIESAMAAFWNAYCSMGNPLIDENEMLQRIQCLKEQPSPPDMSSEEGNRRVCVKLHLLGVELVSLIRVGLPIREDARISERLKEVGEFPYSQCLKNDSFSGGSLFQDDPFLFSAFWVAGIILVEAADWYKEEGKYEKASVLISVGAYCLGKVSQEELEISFDAIAKRIHTNEERMKIPRAKLPHSGCEFDIQNAVDIYEELLAICKSPRTTLGNLKLLEGLPDTFVDPFETIKRKNGEEMPLAMYLAKVSTEFEMQHPLSREKAIKSIREAEPLLRHFVLEELKKHYDNMEWWEKGVPYELRIKCKGIIEDEKNRRPYIEDGEDEKFERLNFRQTKEVVKHNDNWQNIFKDYFKNIKELDRRLNDISSARNLIQHNRELDDQILHDGIASFSWLVLCLDRSDLVLDEWSFRD